MDLKQFKLLNEDNDSYQVGHPNGKSMRIVKAGLSDKAQKLISAMKSKVQKFDDGGQAQSDSVQDSPAQIVADTTPQTDPSVGAAPTPPIPPPANNPPNDAATDAPDQTGGASSSWDVTPTVTPKTAAPQNPMQANEGAFQAEKAANTASANATTGQGNTETKAIQDTQALIDRLPSQQDIVNKYKTKDDALMQAYQNKTIDPDRYVKNMSTGSKIAAGIGMLFTGMGHGDPSAVIHRQIDNDILAQKNDQDKNMNLWKMNREALGNDLAADLATKNQMLTGLKYKLVSAASQFKGPLAQAQAQGENAKIDQEINANRFKLSMMDPTKDGVDPSQKVQFLAPPQQQPKVFEEIKNAQNVSANGHKMMQNFDDAAKDNTILRTGAGLLRTPGSVMALHQGMLPNFKNIDGTVRQAAMDETFHNITPSPGDTDEKIAIKRQALVDWLESEKAAPTARGFGIDLSKYPSTGFNPSKPKPASVVQNGHVYNLNPKTGNYE